MQRFGIGSVPIATGGKYTNCHRTPRSSIPRSDCGNPRARPELTTDISQPPTNWSAPCPGCSERCRNSPSRSDLICFLFADRHVPLSIRGCIVTSYLHPYPKSQNGAHSKTSASRSETAAASFGERRVSAVSGQSMPRSRSFHAIVRSDWGE